MKKQSYAPPIYLQVKDLLMKKIISEEYPQGSQLPSERELSVQYGISRMTARSALTELVREGYAFRSHGKGTFASSSRIERDFVKLAGFTQLIKEKGLRPGSRVLSVKEQEPTKSIADALGITLDQNVYYIERLRYGNDVPIALEHTYVPAAIFQGLLEHDFNVESLFGIIETEYNRKLKYATQWLSITKANSYESKVLDIEVNSPLFMLVGTTYDENDVAVEYTKSLNRGDRCVYYSELWRDPQEAL